MLKVSDLNVAYDHLPALREIVLGVEKGEIVSVIGSNGAGKTTLLKTISGLLRPTSGSVLFEQERIDGLPPLAICQRGIVQVPEGRKIFPRMKVIDNLQMGAYLPRAKNHFRETLEEVFNLFPILGERKKQMAATLSGGEQQMLAIGRGLMALPKLLMLDEPSLGLAPKTSQEIFQTLKKLNKKGFTILLVSQDVLQSLKLGERAYVLENTRIVMEGKGADLLQDQKIREAYLGI
ncbi:MAG: ABC transporter ATP-binding protein [Proteobacteria bacterium]|nr:ABC transporter ATP-binding protein [Pseudomonadota bacterium]